MTSVSLLSLFNISVCLSDLHRLGLPFLYIFHYLYFACMWSNFNVSWYDIIWILFIYGYKKCSPHVEKGFCMYSFTSCILDGGVYGGFISREGILFCSNDYTSLSESWLGDYSIERGLTKPLDINTDDSALLILSGSKFILISAFYIAIRIRLPRF